MTDTSKQSCPCPRCWPDLHVDLCGDLDCAGSCRETSIESAALDLGHSHTFRWARWSPDRELNPQYADVPDVEHAHGLIEHPRGDGSGQRCVGGIVPDTAPPHLTAGRATWHVESLDPLTLSPSILCSCGDHGFIRDGRWIPA